MPVHIVRGLHRHAAMCTGGARLRIRRNGAIAATAVGAVGAVGVNICGIDANAQF